MGCQEQIHEFVPGTEPIKAPILEIFPTQHPTRIVEFIAI
jgi:hypothetical protein